MRVTKKDERLARALMELSLINIGFPDDRMSDRVDEAWPGCLQEAKNLNHLVNNIENWELDGETTKEEIDRWGR